VDLVTWLLEDPDLEVWAQAGPIHPEFGIPLDLTIGMRSGTGCIASVVLSFNNHGPISVTQRFIGEETTLLTDGGTLKDYEGNEIPVEGNSHEIQDREFFDAIREGRKPLTSCAACLPTMRLLDRIEKSVRRSR
jgi:2-hydroxy-4-carboxymuconate semialdehyde hemiacetal dehydrogenase